MVIRYKEDEKTLDFVSSKNLLKRNERVGIVISFCIGIHVCILILHVRTIVWFNCSLHL